MTKVRFAPARGTHRHRVQQAIERARGAGGGRGASGAGGGEGVAARWLDGAAVFGDLDGGRALALLGDDSRRVRGIAICVAPLACDDAQAARALEVAWSVRGERSLLRRMRRHRRSAAIDAFLDRLAADGQVRDLI
ncbi:MAG TPA: hypothetical protein VKB80_27140, partial [Kofleriaceae bacterium]|nr:hypothetical protein [Kofleriaceae bacterium]